MTQAKDLNLSANPFMQRDLARPLSPEKAAELEGDAVVGAGSNRAGYARENAPARHPDGSTCSCAPRFDAQGHQIHEFRFMSSKEGA